MKRVNATTIILRLLQSHAEFTADLFDSYFCSYNESRAKLRGKVLGTTPRIKFDTDWATTYEDRRKFYKLLSLLRATGLIAKSNKDTRSMWSITQKGRDKISTRQPKYVVQTKPSKFPTIVSYDIPETLKRDRDWLRSTLAGLGFTMIHKSFWVGNFIIPESLLMEFRERKILDCLHILEINKTGTFNLKDK